MKKYIIKYADGSEQDCMVATHKTRKEAVEELMEYINNHNEGLDIYDDDYLSPFDFTLEEVELSTADLIPDFESAKRYLNLKEHNEKNTQALVALDELFTIAEAWNKADGFVPDFSDWKQDKWFPWFRYDKGTAGFVSANTLSTPTYSSAYLGSRLCFKTSERAAQFGEKFEELYNQVFL